MCLKAEQWDLRTNSWWKFSWYTQFIFLKAFGKDYNTGFPTASTCEIYFFKWRSWRLALYIQECLLFKEKALLSSKRSWDKKLRSRSEKERENIFLFFLMHYSPSRETDIDIFFPLKIRIFFTLAGVRIGLWTLCAVKLCLESSFCSSEGVMTNLYTENKKGRRNHVLSTDDITKVFPHFWGLS